VRWSGFCSRRRCSRAARSALRPVVTGHLARGMSCGDMKDLGETLEEGDAALVVVGESRIKEAIAKEAKRANRMMEKEIDADAEDLRKQLDAAVDETLGTT
jgi:uncharacterized membrane protein